MGRKHLIALDGTNPSERAIDWYIDNIYRDGDVVCIFHCSKFQLNVYLPGVAVNVEEVSKKVHDAKEKANVITVSAAEKLRSKNIKSFTVVKYGHSPDHCINETVEEHDIDWVFMGTRDQGSMLRAIGGSVSTSVARHCKVPVTIVKGSDKKG